MKATQVTCECGAVYERTEEKVTFRDSDSFQCRHCGKTLDEWSSSRIPVFRLIKEPGEPK
jgi:predicted SprT family Zn-dependent metalloprotease